MMNRNHEKRCWARLATLAWLAAMACAAGVQPALASNGASPADQTAAGEAICQKEATHLTETAPPGPLAGAGAHVSRRPHRARGGAHRKGRRGPRSHAKRSASGGWETLVAITRGPYTLVMATDGTSIANCLTEPDTSSQPAGVTRGSPPPPPVAAHEVGTPSWGFSRARDEQPFLYAYAPVGTGVTGVTILLRSGTHVRATVENGWFMAWWEGESGADPAVGMLATTAHGTSPRPLHTPPEILREDT